MREPIKFESVTTQQQFDELKTFAASDGHVVTDHSIFPIFTMRRSERLFGYFHVINHPIILPAFHVTNCERHDFKEAVEKATAWRQLSSISEQFPNGTCFIALPPEPVIDENLIEKLGYEDIKRKLWQATPR